MKTYKVCFDCILDLKNGAFYDKGGGMKLNANNKFANCKNKPKCFDQPERSKREDSQKCEMRCSEHCGNTVRDK